MNDFLQMLSENYHTYSQLYNTKIVYLVPLGIIFEIIAMGVFYIELKTIPKEITQNYIMGKVISVDYSNYGKVALINLNKAYTMVTIEYNGKQSQHRIGGLLKPEVGNNIKLYTIIEKNGEQFMTPWLAPIYHKKSKAIAIVGLICIFIGFILR